MSHLIFIIPLE